MSREETFWDEGAGAPSEGGAMQGDLRGLAAELREAWPDPSLSADFAGRLRQRAAAPWRWRDAWRREPLLRIAAGLLVACGLAVPVMAMIRLLVVAEPRQPAVTLELPLPRPARSPDDEPVRAVPPALPEPQESSAEGWVPALERDNRFHRLAAAWRKRFAGRPPPAGAAERLAALDDPAVRAGLELRLGLRTAAASLRRDWSAASPGELWAELERQLCRGEPEIPADLVARARKLWDGGDAEARGWLSGWIAVLVDPALARGYPLPEPGGPDLAVFWDAARWELPLLEDAEDGRSPPPPWPGPR